MLRDSKSIVCFVVGTSLCLTSQAFALETGLALELTTEHTDNALRTSTDLISEREDSYNAQFTLSEDTAGWGAEAAYVATRVNFSEDSQRERSFINGDSNLRLGANQSLFQLMLEHSRRLSLIDPTEQDILANTQERSVLSVRPQMNLRLSPVDIFTVGLDYSKVDFSENESRNSSRSGGTVTYSHRFSPVDGFFIRHTSLDIEFNDIANSELSYQISSIGYQASLRNLNYELRVGYNSSEQNGNSVGDKTLGGSLSYQNASLQVEVNYSRELTDNSIGRSLDSSFSEGTVINGQFQQPDQYLNREWQTYVRFLSLCTRCAVNLRYDYSIEQYEIFTQNNLRQTLAQLDYSFDIIGPSEIRAAYAIRDLEFENNTNASQKFDELSIDYIYNFNSNIALTVFASKEKIDGSQPIAIATEKRVGLSLAYELR